jgi:hypothetical protein
MLMYPDSELALIEMEGLFPPKGSMAQGTAEKTLQSHMVVGFEEALEQGLAPMEALGQMLEWVASEMVRINAVREASGAACSNARRDG